MKEIFLWSGSILAILLYFPTLYFIWTDKLKQSFASWFLWVILDAIALGSMIAQNSNNTFVLKIYIVCATTVWASLLFKRQFRWGKKEWLTLLMASTCMLIWKVSGPKWATVASTLAVCISGIPQYIESRNEPDRLTGLIYIGYSFANFLYFLAGEEWSIEERFYPFMMVPLCLSIAFVALQKKRGRVSGANSV